MDLNSYRLSPLHLQANRPAKCASLRDIISSKGIKIDPSKTKAITKMPLPRSVNELQRLLDIVNYLGKFIPNVADKAAPLSNISKKDVAFELQKSQLQYNLQLTN